MSTTDLIPIPSTGLATWPGLGQMLQAPPRAADAYADWLETTMRTPRRELPSYIESDGGSGWFRSVWDAPESRSASEFMRMAPGAWLVFGEGRYESPQYTWNRERQLRAFSVILRGGAVCGFSASPHQRYAVTEGQGVGLAYGGDTMICRTPLPGARIQLASVYFENDEAMEQFGLDVREAHAWLSAAHPGGAVPGVRLVCSTPNTAAVKAARDICWAPYQGARRRLYLRGKASEMLCHLLASPSRAINELETAGATACDDASLAALAHEAASDPEHCPDVVDVAARLRVSASRLLTAFRETYGISLRDHMTNTRMALARRLLTQTNTPLLEIAVACGYEHHSSFSTAYKRSIGETPMETRRAALKN